MKIQILTMPGCGSCVRVEQMLDKLKVKYEIIDIIKNPKILEKYHLLSAPGIVINNKLEYTGVPSEAVLQKLLRVKKK
ncbi:MAG: thioredoxin family protein [Nanoarchaeota archaeon]